MMIPARQAGMARARSRRRLELEEPGRGISEKLIDGSVNFRCQTLFATFTTEVEQKYLRGF